MMWRAMLVGAIALALGRGQTQVPLTCAARADAPSGPDADLYCIELLPADGIEQGAGLARLLPPSSPFGIAVTPAGQHQFDVAFTLRDLPSPSTLGPYRNQEKAMLEIS